MSSRIRVVLFDVGNVSILADHQRTIEAFVTRYGADSEWAEGYFQRPDYRVLARGQMKWHEFCLRVRGEQRKIEITDDGILAVHGEHVYALDTGATELIGKLLASPSAPRVRAVTNTMLPEWMRYDQLGRWDPVAKVLLASAWRSDVQSALKGDEGAFAGIIGDWIPRELGVSVEPREVLLVDDSGENCAAAHAAGLQSFLYCPARPWLLEAYFQECGLFRVR